MTAMAYEAARNAAGVILNILISCRVLRFKIKVKGEQDFQDVQDV